VTQDVNNIQGQRPRRAAGARRAVRRDGVPALTPPWCSGFPPGATPFEFDPGKAREAFAGASWPARRPLRIATPEPFAGIAHILAAGIRSTLDVLVEVIVVPPGQALAGARALMEKKLDLPWDVLVHAWFDLSSEAPPAAVHRELFGLDGAFRAGPPDDGFDALFDEMEGAALVEVAERIDAYVQDQALALFICAPQALYAVNEHVTFSPYKTTFELAEVTVGGRHWSVSGDGAVLGARTGRPAPRRTWTSPTLGGDDRRPERRPPPAGAAHRHAAGRSAPRRGREPARSRAGQGRRADRAGAGPRR
jgi:hypothetical protein